MMASRVLAGLLYIFVELYLDDVLVYAANDDEFLERLVIVFERFRQFNITLTGFGSSRVVIFLRPMSNSSHR